MTRKANDVTSDVAEARLRRPGEEDRQAFEDLLLHRALDEWATRKAELPAAVANYNLSMVEGLYTSFRPKHTTVRAFNLVVAQFERIHLDGRHPEGLQP